MANHLLSLQRRLTRGYMLLLKRPRALLSLVVLVSLAAAYQAQYFSFDASSDTLLVEDSESLVYFNRMVTTFGESSFVVLTFTPEVNDLFSEIELSHISALQTKLNQLDGVKNTVSILDVPLLKSPQIKLDRFDASYTTLGDGTADVKLAREELRASPLFSELLISRDGNTAVIQINLEDEPALTAMYEHRRQLREDPEASSQQLAQVEEAYFALSESAKQRRADLLGKIRSVRDQRQGEATIRFGGVPMVAGDMIDYVRADTINFGVAILLLVALSLWFFFRKMRWVLLPLLSSAVSILWMIGLLGYFKEAVTVVSSSFVPLVAIITISFNVHLIVRYRELRQDQEAEQYSLVCETMLSKLAPCIYTALTTMVAFSSLLTSGIEPVSSFGWMMCMGVGVSLLATYLLFPAVLILVSKAEPSVTVGREQDLTIWFRDVSIAHPSMLLLASLVLALLSAVGMLQLSLENRFVDYFKDGTEIRRGMLFLDQKLGGTMPLDIIIQQPPYEEWSDGFDDFTVVEDPYPERYWYTEDKIRMLEQIQNNLEARPEIGKVISLSNLERVARDFNDGEPLDTNAIHYVLGAVPRELRKSFIEPYASPHTGELRISARIRDSGEGMSRAELLADIEKFCVEEVGLSPENVRLTGMAVLFNEMLNQLFSSQASTIGFVLVATYLMFSILLGSTVLGLVGILPNLVAPMGVLGFMGYAGIPLDMMTITIAAIVVGIGVDDAIHYLHRYKAERATGATVKLAIQNSHGSIGRAMYFTSLTVIFGFSVLSFSNFIPTVYFGLLTALAMALALVANLTVLPALLLRIYGTSDDAEIAEV